MRPMIVVGLFFCFVAPVNATLKVSSPSQACDLMRDFGLNTRGWKNQYDQVFGCSSAYKEIGAGPPMANNLAFYAEGNSNNVSQFKLVLNVNNRSSSTSAHMELVKATAVLAEKATGEKLPQSLIDAMKEGTKATQRIGASTVDVIRIDWPTGKGYEIRVLIK